MRDRVRWRQRIQRGRCIGYVLFLYSCNMSVLFSVLFQVGVKIDASSFSLTRIVTFVPFYMLVNRTKHSVFICEDGQETWTEAKSEEVRACSDFSLFEQCRLRSWFWFEYIIDTRSWVFLHLTL